MFPEGTIVSYVLAKPAPKPTPKPAPKRGNQPVANPAARSSSIFVADGQHVQLFKTMWDWKKKYTVPVQQYGHAAN